MTQNLNNRLPRTATTREATSRSNVYVPSTEQSRLSEELISAFKKKGFHIRWVRWQIDGQEDAKNISEYLRTGYEFVNSSEIPAEELSRFELKNSGRHQGMLTNGDLVLMKATLELIESRDAYYEKMSLDQIDAVRKQMQTNRTDLNKQLPMFDESRSTTALGGRQKAGFGLNLNKPATETED